MDGLEAFIVRAKAATYVGNGAVAATSRVGSHDLVFEDCGWAYRDSYFGGTDFVGQEVVWQHGEPRWAMNYYGRILRDDLIDGGRAAAVIRSALSALYAQGRFLGGYQTVIGDYYYSDQPNGQVHSFSGIEEISTTHGLAYRLDYHGGLIKA